MSVTRGDNAIETKYFLNGLQIQFGEIVYQLIII